MKAIINKESSRRFRLDKTTLFGLTLVAIGILLSVFGTITTTTPASPETCACPAVGTCNCTAINPATVTSDYTLNSLGLFILVIGLFFTIAHSFGVDLF